MKKILFALATMAMLFSAAPVFAQDSACSQPVAEFSAAAKTGGLQVLSMKDDVLKNFMAFFETLVGPAPVEEYDEVVMITDHEGAKIMIALKGCILIGTRTFPYSVIQPFMKEANLDG